MIKTYLKWVKDNPNSPVAVEQRFAIDIEGVLFNGFIDRVEKTSEGKFAVVDFKTGGEYKNSRSIKENPHMNIYALGVEKLYGQMPEKTFLFYLKHNKSGKPYRADPSGKGQVCNRKEGQFHPK